MTRTEALCRVWTRLIRDQNNVSSLNLWRASQLPPGLRGLGVLPAELTAQLMSEFDALMRD